MKNHLTFRSIFLVLTSVFFITTSYQNLYAQDIKKNKVRLKADYVKIMDGVISFDIKATSKIKKKNIEVSNINLAIYNVIDDEKIKLGTTITDNRGKCKFILKNINAIKTDSLNTYNILIEFKGNDTFKKAAKRLNFKNANIEASIITKDSINYISAKLIDKSKDSVISGESLSIQIQRLFSPLIIGEEFNNTDHNGTILVPFEEKIPGIDGNLIFEVVLNDHDEFGTVKALIKAPLGIPIVEESTFNERTLWSPRNKTPIFILLFANLLIIGMWGLIIYLIVNLFKIKKTKTSKHETI